MWKQWVITIAILAWMPITILAAEPAKSSATAPAANHPIRVLLVTGGHPFKRDAFFAMFNGVPDIRYKEVTHPTAQAEFNPEKSSEYDVMVLFDMWWKEFPEVAKQNLLKLLRQGKPLVILHHALNTYKDWREFDKIVGAEYYLKERDGHPESNFTMQVKFKVEIVDPDHPITKGMKDFEILDETYGLVDVFQNVKPLLKTAHPKSMKTIGWTHNYENSPIVFIQPGHGPTIFKNPNYRKLVMRSIRWAAGRLGADPAVSASRPTIINQDPRSTQTQPAK